MKSQSQNPNPFTEVFVMPGTILKEDPSFVSLENFEKEFKEIFGCKIKYIGEVKTIEFKDSKNEVVHVGGRNDLFFYIHDEDLGMAVVGMIMGELLPFSGIVNEGFDSVYPEKFLTENGLKS